MFFLGDRQISRADYVEAVGAADCDPHVMIGRTNVKPRKGPRDKAGRRR